MELQKTTRPLYPEEISMLEKLRVQINGDIRSRFRLYHYLLAAALGAALVYVAIIVGVDGYLRFVSGTLAVLAFAFLVFGPSEANKKRKRLSRQLSEIDSILQNNHLTTIPINALNLAIAEEFEDEGDLVIIEYAPGKILYLWDQNYGLGLQFPCLQFDIYDKPFFQLTGRQVFSKSELIVPVILDKKSKWAYLDKYETPADMHTESANFDEVVDRFRKASAELTTNLL